MWDSRYIQIYKTQTNSAFQAVYLINLTKIVKQIKNMGSKTERCNKLFDTRTYSEKNVDTVKAVGGGGRKLNPGNLKATRSGSSSNTGNYTLYPREHE